MREVCLTPFRKDLTVQLSICKLADVRISRTLFQRSKCDTMLIAWLEDSATLASDANAMSGGTGEGRVKLPF